MTYAEICDDLIKALQDHASAIGVSKNSNVEGGKVAAMPMISIVVEPKFADMNYENGKAEKIKAVVWLAYVATKKDDITARRDGMLKASAIKTAIEGSPYSYKYNGATFAESDSNTAVTVTELEIPIDI